MTNITRIGLAVDSTQVRRANTELHTMQRSGQRAQSSVAALGKSLVALGAGAAVVSGLAKSLKDVASFETALLGVSKTTGLVGRDLNQFAGQIDLLSRKIPVSTNELLGLSQAAGQMGVSGSQNLEKFATTVAKLGRASDLAGDQAATALARILNVTGESISDIDVLASVIVSLGNNVAATESEIARMTTEVARATAAFEVSSSEAAAMAAAMTSIGIRAELGGSSVGRAMQEITSRVQAGGKELEEFAGALGLNADTLARLFAEDKTAAFRYFLEQVGELGLDAGNALETVGLGGQEIAKTIIPLSNNMGIFARTMALANAEVENATALDQEFEATLGSLESQWIRTQNVMNSFSRGLGSTLAPALTSTLEDFNDWAAEGGVEEALEATSTAATALAVVLGARLTASATAATGSFIAAQASAIRYQATLASMAGVSRTAAVSQVALAGAVRGAAGAMALVGGPVGAAVIAAAGLVYFVTRTDNTIDRARELEQQLQATSGAFDDLTKAQARVQRLEVQDSLQQATEEVERLESKYEEMQKRLSSRGRGGEMPDTFLQMERAIEAAEGRVDTFSEALQRLDGVISGSGYHDDGGDPFALSPSLQAMIDGKTPQAVDNTSDAIARQIEILQKHNNMLESGMDVEEAELRISDLKLAARLREQEATEEQIDTYLRLQGAIREATEAAKKRAEEQREEQNRIESLEQQLDLFRSMADPLHEINKQMETLKDIFDEGLINQDEFEKLAEALERTKESAGGIGSELEGAGESGRKAFRVMQRSMKEGSKEYRQMEVAIQAANVAAAVGAVLNQGQGDPYTAFARMAVMAASVASLGYSVGNLSGGSDTTAEDAQARQGTGTVLGDMEAKSESIANATEITADATSELVGINQGMLQALQAMQEGISGATSQVLSDFGNADFRAPMENLGWIDQKLGSISDAYGSDTMAFLGELGANPIRALTGFDPLGDWINDTLGGSSDIVNQGIQIFGGTLDDLMSDIVVHAFRSIETKKHFLDDADVSTRSQQLGEEATAQFQLVFRSMADAVSEGAEALGMNMGQVRDRIENFSVQMQEISLHGLDAEQQQAELEAVFSSIFDNLTSSVLPWIDEFQQVGEGIGETLARVATNVQVMEEAVARLGFAMSRDSVREMAQFSTDLIEMAGGLDQFIAGMGGFVDTFATEQHKFETIQSDMQRAFERLNLEIPETRDGMWELMQSLDAGTESGRRQIAALLELTDVADEYYKQLDKAQREQRKAFEDARSAGVSAVQEFAQSLQSELSGIRGALSGLMGDIDPAGERSRAMETLRNALLTGDFSGTGQAAQLAAQVNADRFSSAEAMRREQARTAFLLDSLEREGEQQLTTAEESLNALESIDSGIENVADILERLRREITFGGDPLDIPQFAGGGLHGGGLRVVGESGPELEMTGPSRITSNSDLQSALAANTELLQEIRDLKRYIRQTTKNTGETRDQLNRWNREGLPEERDFA